MTNNVLISEEEALEKDTNINATYIFKKRKIEHKNSEINANFCKNNRFNAKLKEYEMVAKAYETDLIVEIKALLQASRTIPNIIKILDRIIEERASTYISSASIFSTRNSTYDQVDKVIDLSERKEKLLNIYIIVNDMLKSLSEQERTLVKMKFISRYKTEEIAGELNMNERTIYRKSIKLIEKIAVFMLKNNYDSNFIMRQIRKEPWITDLINRKKQEQNSNLKRAIKNKK